MNQKIKGWVQIRVFVIIVLFQASINTAMGSAAKGQAAFDPALSTDSLKNTLSIGLTASNNSYFFGRSTSIKYPYLTADATYKFKSGAWFSVSLYDIFNTGSTVDETDLLAGYDIAITDRLTGSVSYARYFYGASNPLIKSTVSNIANGYLGLDWSYLFTSLTASYIFGGTNDIFLSLNNSRYFGKEALLSSEDYLGIEPTLNVLAGTQEFTQTYTSIVNTTPAGKNRKTQGAPATKTTTVTKTRFSFLNYGLYLPVTYGYKNSSLELSWRLLVPVNAPDEYNARPQSFFTISFYQTFKH